MVARNFITVPGEAFNASGAGAVERTVDDKLRDVVSVKDFGAVGDGAADDTAALQAAIDSSASVITSPVPLYVNTGAVTVNLVSNQKFKGITFVSVDNTGSYCLTGNNVSNVEFIDCEFQLNNRQRACILSGTGSDIVLENCKIVSNSTVGYSAYGFNFAGSYSNLKVLGCYFENVCGSASLKFSNASKVIVSNNLFKSSLADPGVSNRPDYPTQVDLEIGSDATVVNNIFDIPLSQDPAVTSGSLGYGFYQGDGKFDRITVANNVIKSLGIVGRSVGIKHGGGTYSSDCLIQGNQITGGNLWYGISLNTSTKTNIVGNFVDDAGQAAISVERSYTVNILNNDARCASGGTPHVLFIGDGADYSIPSGLNVVQGNYLKKESTGSNRGCVAFRTYHSTTIVQNNVLDSSDGLAYIRDIDAGVNIDQSNASTYSVVITNDADNTKLNSGTFVDPLPTLKVGRQGTYTAGAASLFSVTSTGKSVFELTNTQASTNTVYSALNFTNSSSGLTGRRPCFVDTLTSDSVARGRFRIGVTNASNNEIYVEVNSNDRFIPSGDGSLLLGSGSTRWNTIFSTSGTINTSDEREKQNVADLEESELRVARKLKTLIKKFKFTSAVAEKGDKARTHIGVLAQQVISAFEEEGLDPFEYGLVCYDTWEEETTGDGELVRSAGDRYGVRYEELLAFIVSSL